MNRKITIIGAGLVGSLWAVLLTRRGFDVTVFEKRSDIRAKSLNHERSINLVITSRGLNGLEAAGLLNEAIALSVPIFGRMIHSKSGDLTFQPYGKDNECNFSISRGELNKFLLTAAEKSGAQVYFEHALEDIDFQSRTLKFENGKEVHYDMLFGTDGAGSRVRKNLCKSFAGEFHEDIDWLEADYKELFLPADSDGRYKIEKNALHIWPRGSHMMMALANLDGSFTVTAYMPKSGARVSFEELSSAGTVTSLFAEEFSDVILLVPSYAQDFMNNPQGKLGTVKCTRWVFDDSVVLLGDAAHAIVPFFGQGMNCGFEDCLNFLKVFDELNGDWSKTLLKFETIQKPNADAIADMAIENWQEMRDKVADTKFLLKKKVEALLEKEFPDLFKSRYGMVTYTMIPYAIAREAGRLQDQILLQLCANINSPEQVSLNEAESLLKSVLLPFLEKHKIRLSTDRLVIAAKHRFQ